MLPYSIFWFVNAALNCMRCFENSRLFPNYNYVFCVPTEIRFIKFFWCVPIECGLQIMWEFRKFQTVSILQLFFCILKECSLQIVWDVAKIPKGSHNKFCSLCFKCSFQIVENVSKILKRSLNQFFFFVF